MDEKQPSHGSDELPLTPRQLEIFHLLAKGLSNREICEVLGISNNTVKIHVAAILKSLNVSNRTEAVFIYRELLERPESEPGSRQLRIVDRVGRPGIAVLPFADLSGSRADDHLAEAIAEELLVSLSAWRWFPVISYASSSMFSEAEQSYAEIGRQLGAAYLVTGTLRRAETQIRVTAKLVMAATGQVHWSRSFDLPLGELLELQDEIANHVVRSLAPELLEDQARQLLERPERSFGAWEHACRGYWYLNRGGKEDAAAALACFDEAIAEDPELSFAWNGRACALQKQLYEQWADDPPVAVGGIQEAAEHCLRLEPRASHSHANAGLAAILTGRREAAIDHLELAAELNPNSTRALVLLAQTYGMAGQVEEAVMHLEELLRIDPHSPSAYSYRNILGMCCFVLGRRDEAIRWARSAIALQPRASGAYLSLTAALVREGRADEARAVVDELFAQVPDFELGRRLSMMRPLTDPGLLKQLSDALAEVGLVE